MRQFHAPQTMTAEELGDSLARLVWESFSDFISAVISKVGPEDDGEISPAALGVPTDEEGVPDPTATEEALIFHLWAHTRGTQLAFHGRDQVELVRKGLDVMHRAVFEDMMENGTPESQIPIFEQRVSARYSDYYQAADISDAELGAVVMRYLTGQEQSDEALARAASARAIAVAKPLRDFLEEVELTA